jgi:hypothetical protein
MHSTHTHITYKRTAAVSNSLLSPARVCTWRIMNRRAAIFVSFEARLLLLLHINCAVLVCEKRPNAAALFANCRRAKLGEMALLCKCMSRFGVAVTVRSRPLCFNLIPFSSRGICNVHIKRESWNVKFCLFAATFEIGFHILCI